MSAFFVGVDHINAMLTFAEDAADRLGCRFSVPDSTWSRDEAVLTKMGLALITENVASLRARYPTDYESMLGESLESLLEGYRYERDPRFLAQSGSAVATVKLVDCYEYQSCEHDEWAASYAHKFCNELARCAASRVAGYDAAPWGYERGQRAA